MYSGNHTRFDVTARLSSLQAVRHPAQKPFFAQAMLMLLITGFVLVDFITIQLYTMSLFDETPLFATAVALAVAAILDACPSMAAAILSHTTEPGAKHERRFKTCLLLGAAAGAYIIFCGFCIVSSLMAQPASVSGGLSQEIAEEMSRPSQGSNSLSMAAQLIRMLVPLATSVGAFGLSYSPDRAKTLSVLKKQRLDIMDLEIDVENACKQLEYALEHHDPDMEDYRFACAKMQAIVLAAERARIECRMKLAEELGSVEETNALLQRAGLEKLFDEEELLQQLLPPDTLESRTTSLKLGDTVASLDLDNQVPLVS